MELNKFKSFILVFILINLWTAWVVFIAVNLLFDITKIFYGISWITIFEIKFKIILFIGLLIISFIFSLQRYFKLKAKQIFENYQKENLKDFREFLRLFYLFKEDLIVAILFTIFDIIYSIIKYGKSFIRNYELLTDFIMILLGISSISLSIMGLIRKETYYFSGVKINPKKNPHAFWILIIFEFIAGLALIFFYLWFIIKSN